MPENDKRRRLPNVVPPPVVVVVLVAPPADVGAPLVVSPLETLFLRRGGEEPESPA